MVIVDIAGMDRPCSNILSFCGSGGVFRRLWGSFLRLWVSFLMYFWYPDGQTAMNGHRCPKREPFSTKKSSNRAPFGPPFLLKIDVFLLIFDGPTLGWYLMLLLEAHGCQNVCFLRWLTFTEHNE